MPYIVEKLSMRATTLLRFHLNQRFAQEVMGLQSCGSLNFKNSKTLDLGVLKKMTFGCSPMASHREYYKREGGGFLQV
jgi:hypothetical protein